MPPGAAGASSFLHATKGRVRENRNAWARRVGDTRDTVTNVSTSVHHGHLHESRVLAPDVVEYDFALSASDTALGWRGGQFISIRCGDTPTGDAIMRSYSLANRGGGGHARLVVKLVEGPGSAWFRALAPGSP